MPRVVALAACLVLPVLAQAADDTWEIKTTDATVTVGTRGSASVTITSKRGWHLNQEAPLTLKLSPTPGVALDKPKLGRADLARSTDKEARFDVGLTLSEPGKKLVEAVAGFVLCREDSCRPIKAQVTLAAQATAPSQASAPAVGKPQKTRKKR
jgi:hypothetical protein